MKNVPILIQLATIKKKDCIHKRFTFAHFNYVKLYKTDIPASIPNCGSSGCLLGELPGLTQDWYFNGKGELMHISTDSVCEYFGLTITEVLHLFYPESQSTAVDPESTPLPNTATLRQVQANLKRFLKLKNIEF